MSARHSISTLRSEGAATPGRTAADVAYRRAWWSLALYPLSFALAFVIGEGLFTMLDDDIGDPALWVVLVSFAPALLVFVLPGALAVRFGRTAIRLGRSDGRTPAAVGVAIGIGFACLNLLAYVAQLMSG